MIKFFNPENKFWIFVAKICDVFLMGMLWCVCSLPIVTAGASTAAFYDFTMKQVRDEEGGIWKSFFSSFKRCFKKATLIWLIELALIAFLVLDFVAAWNMYVNAGALGFAFLVICACAALIVLCCVEYVYPLLAVFDFPLKKTLGNSFIMAMGNLPVTITLILITAAVCAGVYFMSGLTFFWFGLGVFFSSYFITGVFAKYTGEAPSREQLRAEKRAAKKRGRDFF